MTIAVVGSINLDIVTRSPRLPKAGETLHGSSYATFLGGKGCNQAVAASRLGSTTHFIGRVGQDGFGQEALTQLASFGVSRQYVQIDEKTATGIAVIGVDANAENAITVIGGANMALDESDIQRALEPLQAADILLLQLEIPMAVCEGAARLAHNNGATVIFDPAPAPKEGLPDSLLGMIDIITPNESETYSLTGILPTNALEAEKAANALHDKGVKAAIIKLGAHGVFYSGYGTQGFVKPFKVEAIDSVAAGDCFNAGLAHSLDCAKAINSESFAEAVRYAAACGALATTKHGAAPAAPYAEEVHKLLG
ncbi:ribokinase [Polycladidibacter stylochi]|uniref:ribokinase n=1 Tax=Polycladidibacter stylochi TaxID=1807766 RepID=UPI0008356DDD|nr:ribokinase [Pseudovibrio stylochi]